MRDPRASRRRSRSLRPAPRARHAATNDSAQAIDRIIDVFPAERQGQIRIQLASSLIGVIAQRLLPRIDGGRVAAFELLLANTAVRNLIREGKTEQLRNVIATGQRAGMQTLESHLRELVATGIVGQEEASGATIHSAELKLAT